jgi:hypothetical protein
MRSLREGQHIEPFIYIAFTDLYNVRRIIIYASRGPLRGMDRVLEDKLRLFGRGRALSLKRPRKKVK